MDPEPARPGGARSGSSIWFIDFGSTTSSNADQIAATQTPYKAGATVLCVKDAIGVAGTATQKSRRVPSAAWLGAVPECFEDQLLQRCIGSHAGAGGIERSADFVAFEAQLDQRFVGVVSDHDRLERGTRRTDVRMPRSRGSGLGWPHVGLAWLELGWLRRIWGAGRRRGGRPASASGFAIATGSRPTWGERWVSRVSRVQRTSMFGALPVIVSSPSWRARWCAKHTNVKFSAW